MYERERNPVGVWRAYAEYRGAKMTSFPEWILEYFDRTPVLALDYGALRAAAAEEHSL